MSSSTKTTSTAKGSFAPIEGGRIRTDDDFDLQNLTEEEQEVVTADQFIVYGRANIEQWNDPPEGDDHLYIELDALEERLDQLFALNNLSRQHQDVKVGEFRESYELQEPTTIHLDRGETLRFDAGDVLETQVVREGDPLPGAGGEPAQEDALWIVANIYGRDDTEGSLISEETRLASYYGMLDGFSVTIYTREYELEEQGKRPTEVDFLAVTIGDDRFIKNPGSTYGVAEFQAIFGTDDADTTPAGSPATAEATRWIANRLTSHVFDNLFGQAKKGLVAETIRTAYEQEMDDLEAAAQAVVDEDADAEHIASQAEERLADIREDVVEEEMDRDDLAAEVADEIGMDVEDVHTLLDELEAAGQADNGDDEDKPNDGQDDDDDDTDVIVEGGMDADDIHDLVGQAVDEAVTSALDDRLSDLGLAAEADDPDEDDPDFVTQSDLDEAMDQIGSQLDDALGDIGESVADNLEQQLAVAGTPSPSGGSVHSESDLKEELDSIVDQTSWGRGDGGDD